MSIERFFDKSAVVLRFSSSEIAGNFVQQESEVATVPGHLQQASLETVSELGLSLTKSFSYWCALSSDVQEGDKLRIGSSQYGVKAVMINDASPTNPHKELILEKLEGVYGGS